MKAKKTLSSFQKIIEPLIEESFAGAEAQAQQISPVAAEAINLLKEYTLRKAKRLRAAFIYYSYLMLGGDDKSAILNASISIEILHAYLLIHDDVMDQDSLRRGEPTMHKIYERIHAGQHFLHDAAHFGESMAISLGDVGAHLANKQLIDSNFPSDRLIKAASKFNNQIATVGYGQMLDILSSVKSSVTEDDVMQVHRYKTASYTYETPLHVGAILAGANEKDLEDLSGYAVPAGIAFQIQDDILGMFGDEEKLGKPNISDLREGKNTLLILKALEKANPSQKKTIVGALGNSEVSDAQADEVRQIIRETGSLEYSKSLAVELVKKAKEALSGKTDWTGEGRDFIDGIADYMIEREF
ncbi:polyprenyl synthetase family protein [Candidatus Dojkabacteria bacterium]|uniref:Polyprenyl synthetase family protein n=1 Tax=Candidatus Dojkabacteria bacterium TaxID=2099670 RepID=A0A955KYW1_9BACT|nr:polyprenyl synthetase family protein [Candidatus Dojkabacteria bacterium]